MDKKKLYLIGGCHGAGKTAASSAIFPEILHCNEFVNADEIARELSPIRSEKVLYEADQIMLNRMNELITQNKSFVLEVTLAGLSYEYFIIKAKKKGYQIILLYFWLQQIELAIERVKIRVAEGGCHVDSEVIIRDYRKGIKNLFNTYIAISDSSLLFDTSTGMCKLFAVRLDEGLVSVVDSPLFNHLKKYYYDEL